MVDSCVCNFDAAVASCWRTPALQNEHRRSACFTHLGPQNFFHGPASRMQRISASRLQSSCKSLRLGAAEEGESSWEDKLQSTSTRKGDILKGDSDSEWRDRIVDEEGNIDNIEQEQTRSPCVEDTASEQWPGKEGARPDDVHDLLARDQDQSQQQYDNSCAASRFNPTYKNFRQSMEGPTSAQTMDWKVMAKRGPIGPSFSNSKLWQGEDGIKEGDKGEAIVGNVHVSPLRNQGEVSTTQSQEREKYGWSETTCDEGSLSRSDPHVHGNGKTMQDDKLQEEEEVFLEDEGRTPDDYHRRADLFGKSGEQFVAQKQRDERKCV